MNTIVSRMLSVGLFFLLIFLSGFWLSRTGKPYPMILITVHKLISLVAIIYLGMSVHRIQQAAPLQTVQIIAVALTALCFVSLLITGGLASLDKAMPSIILNVHHVLPYLTVISVGLNIYLLLLGKGQLISSSN
ncbi:MAG: hypothetical protein WD751_08830 [Anaerolineales bacterium]